MTCRFAILVLAVLTGLSACTVPNPEPVTMTPPQSIPLQEALTEGTLAVVDFDDQRPDLERRAGSLQDTFINNEFLPPGHFWYQRSAELDELPDAVVEGREVFLRLTGEGAFRWHEFPPAQPGAYQTSGTAQGLSDYFALALEQRGIIPRVIRVGSRAAALEAGARYVLEGRIEHFAAGMTEVHGQDDERLDERLDDRRDHRVFSRLGLILSLHSLADDHLLWDARFVDPLLPEDEPHLLDETEDFRGVTSGVGGPRLLRLDVANEPRQAFHDMVAHVDRRLRAATTTSITAIEATLRGGFPID